MADELKDLLKPGHIYHLFYRDNSSAKRPRHIVIFILEDGTLFAMTLREYTGNVYREHVKGLKPGNSTTKKVGKGSREVKKTLIMLVGEGSTVCLGLTKRTKKITIERGGKLRDQVECCLRLATFTGEHTPLLIGYDGKIDKEPYCNQYIKYSCEDPWRNKFHFPGNHKFSFFDETVTKADQLPPSEVVLDQMKKTGNNYKHMFQSICVFISNWCKKLFVK